MNHKRKDLDLKIIAAHLQLRLQRLLYKAETLGLTINKHGTVQKEEAIILVQSYIQSQKTSNSTKQRAQQLLSLLDNEPQNLLTKSSSIYKPKKRLINSRKKGIVWYKQFINTSTDFVQSIFTPVLKLVQTILKYGVQSLESTYFKFLALIIAISVQMHHSAIWFQRVKPDENTSMYAAYGYAFMVDLFILVVTMEGKLSIAKTFASLTFLSNVLYFQFWVNFKYSAQAYTNAISSLLISGIMAYIIYAYTELFVKYRKTNLT